MKKLNQHWQALEPAQEWEKKEKIGKQVEFNK